MPYSTPIRLNEIDSTATGRRIIETGKWVFCSSRTVGGRFTFSELSKKDQARVMGLLIVAMKRYGVEVAAFVLFSNHLHVLARTWRNGRQISLFNQYLKAGMARLVHDNYGTSGTIWDGTYAGTNLLDDEAEIEQFRYICSHGVKEKLVLDPSDWHLCNTIDAVRTNGWINGLFPARGNRKKLCPVRARLTPLTAWTDNRKGWRQICNSLVDGIIADAAHTKVSDLLPLTKDSLHCPEVVKKSGFVRTYKAGGEGSEALLADAYGARRAAIESAVFAVHQLVHTGRANVTLPASCQWPPFVANALAEPYVAMTWSAVYALPRQTAT
jgi:REP element-mobilizing transposase RayT